MCWAHVRGLRGYDNRETNKNAMIELVLFTTDVPAFLDGWKKGLQTRLKCTLSLTY